ncbi:medium-chain fatty acid ethyl ester synthase/esterase 2, partial [Coemansia sp. RSA 455]
VGFSLGANILTKYMGEEGDKCPFIAAISVCNPFDINATMNLMSKPSFKNRFMYAAGLTKKLIKGFVKNKPVIMAAQPDLDAEEIVKARTMNEFNEAYPVKVFGYESAEQLNISGSSVHYLKDIKVPTLFINALNDPICDKSTIPYEEIANNPYLLLACTKYGGHLAYFEGLGLKPWLPKQLAQFAQAMIEW